MAAAAVHSGKLGKLLVSRALCYKPRGSIGVKPTGDPPAEVAFDIWLGPAPQQPYHGNLVHYNWHWFWDFGNGDIGNQGVHEMDKARWLIPPTSSGQSASAVYPKTVLSVGGRFGYHDQGETANTQISIMDYGDTQLIFEVRGLKTEGFQGQKVGNIAHLEAGILVGGKFYPKGKAAVPLGSIVSLEAEPRPRRRSFRKLHRGDVRAVKWKTSMPTFSKDTIRRRFATWLTSHTGLERKYRSTNRPGRSVTTRTLTRHLAEWKST